MELATMRKESNSMKNVLIEMTTIVKWNQEMNNILLNKLDDLIKQINYTENDLDRTKTLSPDLMDIVYPAYVEITEIYEILIEQCKFVCCKEDLESILNRIEKKINERYRWYLKAD